MHRHPGVILLSVMFAASCGRVGGDSGISEIVRQDSAGIEIVEVPGAMLDSLPAWHLSAEPMLSIGEEEGEAPYMLDRVAGAVRLEGGTIVIADGSREIRYFDADGGFLRSVGGRGAGPGEFNLIQVMAPHEAGMLFVDDLQQRMTVLDGAGEVVSIEPRGRDGCQPRMSHGIGNLNCAPHGAMVDGTVVTRQQLGGPPPGQAAAPSVTGGLKTYIGMNRGDGIVDVDSLPRAAQAFVRVAMDTDNDGDLDNEIPVLGPQPFDGQEAVTVGRRRIALGTGDRFEIRFRDAEGALTRRLRVHRAAQPVTREHLDAYAERTEYNAAILDAAGAADSVPHFRRLRLDDADRLWAEEYPIGDDTPAWIVFDADGAPAARVHLPPGLMVYQIGEDFVLGRETDDLGVQRVVMYAIEAVSVPR